MFTKISVMYDISMVDIYVNTIGKVKLPHVPSDNIVRDSFMGLLLVQIMMIVMFWSKIDRNHISHFRVVHSMPMKII